MSTTAPPRRQVQARDEVIFDGRTTAIVTKVNRPEHPDSTVDLVHYADGVPRFLKDIPHRKGSDGWRFASEHDDDRIRTPLELLQEARERGEQTPEDGLWVVYAENRGRLGYTEIHRARARITKVDSLSRVTLVLYPDFPPNDPTLPDNPRPGNAGYAIQNCPRADPEVKRNAAVGFNGCWEFKDGELIKPIGLIETWRLSPSAYCPRCLEGAPRLIEINFGSDGLTDVDRKNREIPKLCPACCDLLLAWIATPPPKPARRGRPPRQSVGAGAPATIDPAPEEDDGDSNNDADPKSPDDLTPAGTAPGPNWLPLNETVFP